MKAVLWNSETHERFFDGNVSLPIVEKGMLLIRMTACSINQSDILFGEITTKKSICGTEFCGIIQEVGQGVVGFSVGDHICGITPVDEDGCWAEYVIVRSCYVIKNESGLSDLNTCSLFGAGVLAHTVLHYDFHVAAGDSILIIDPGVYSRIVMVQLALLWKCIVLVPVSSPKEMDFVPDEFRRNLRIIENGMDLDLTRKVMEETGGVGVDFVVDSPRNISARKFYTKLDMVKILAPRGKWAVFQEDFALSPAESSLLFLKGVSISFSSEQSWVLTPTQIGRFRHILHNVLELAKRKQLLPIEIKCFPLVQFEKALNYKERFGETILLVPDSGT